MYFGELHTKLHIELQVSIVNAVVLLWTEVEDELLFFVDAVFLETSSLGNVLHERGVWKDSLFWTEGKTTERVVDFLSKSVPD